MIALSDLRGNLSSPYKIIETKSSLERFDKPHESKVACTWLRRLFLCRWYDSGRSLSDSADGMILGDVYLILGDIFLPHSYNRTNMIEHD